jgi:ankyrin repeat protein
LCFSLQVAKYLLDNSASLIYITEPGSSDGSDGEERGPFAVDFIRSSCLVAAAVGGDPAILELLLDHGAPPDQHWEQALAEAALQGHMEVVHILMRIAPPVPPAQVLEQQWLEQEQLNAAYGWDFTRNPIYMATAGNQVEVLELLLPDGRWNSRAAFSRAMTTAASRGYVSAMKLLMQYGAGVNSGPSSTQYPLNDALMHTQLAAAEFLLQAGAKPEGSAIMFAVKSTQPVAACRLLLQYGAKDTAQNDALQSAAKEHRQGAVHVLLAANEHSLSHMEKTSRLEAALTGAASGGNLQLVQELLVSLDQHLAGGGKESDDARLRALTNALKAVEGTGQGQRDSWWFPLFASLSYQLWLYGVEEPALPTCDWGRVVKVLTEARSRAEGMQEQPGMQGDASDGITATAATGDEK